MIQDWEDQGKTTVKTYTAFLNRLGVTDPRQFDDRYRDSHRPLSEIVRKGLPLVLPSTEWEPDWMPPGALLRADLGIVRFHQRQRELAELNRFQIGFLYLICWYEKLHDFRSQPRSTR